MENGARAHNHFCVMPKIDPHFAFRHPANSRKCYSIIHSSPLGLLVLCWASMPTVHHIEALCISPRAWLLSKAVFECCIIVSALSSGFMYLLQGEAVTCSTGAVQAYDVGGFAQSKTTCLSCTSPVVPPLAIYASYVQCCVTVVPV